MITTIDAVGRVLVPKAIREQAGLEPGTPLEITFRDGYVALEPLPRQVRIEGRRGLRVAEPVGSCEPLGEETVRGAREHVRVRRA